MKQENYIKKSLLWDITRRCNLSCIHCYNSGGISTEQELEIAPITKQLLIEWFKLDLIIFIC